MSNAIPFILAWIIIALPVFFLAYGVFLIKENKAGKYRAIYGRAAIMIGLFTIIIGSYVFLPYLMGKAAGPSEYPVEGAYHASYSGDTLTLRNGAVTIKSKRQEDNITGNFSITKTNSSFDSQFEAGLNAMIGEHSVRSGRTRMLTISWIDSSAYKKALINSKTSKKIKNNNYLNNPQYRSASWWIETKNDNELTLSPANNNNSNTLFFTKL